MDLISYNNNYYSTLKRKYLSHMNQFNCQTQGQIKDALRLAMMAGYQEGLKAAQNAIGNMKPRKIYYSKYSDDLEYNY